MRKYLWSVVFYSIALGGLCILGVWLFSIGLVFCGILCVLTLIGLVSALYTQQVRLVEEMRKIIGGIQYSDFTYGYSGKNVISKALARDMDYALSMFRKKAYEQEIARQFDETLLRIIDEGIMVIDNREKVEWFNESALRELSLMRISTLQELSSIDESIPDKIRSLRVGEVQVIRFRKGEEIRELAATKTLFQAEGKPRILITLKNIHSVLEQKEMISWQKLISVLTHEIMNSITPVISLSETLTERTANREVNEKDFHNMQQALSVIHRRSKGLLGFVENYRKLSRLPEPIFSKVAVSGLFEDIRKLYPDIIYSYEETGSLELWIDRGQIEQVLINLIKNAYEACEKTDFPMIRLDTYTDRYHKLFRVRIHDNGTGISPEAADKIFLPFYTTKATGSGIGLSLCKQIMTAHGGSISCLPEPEHGTCFTLKFNL